MKKTSLNDIAQQLGVSKTLVSLVLNGKGREHRISEEVCNKVIALAFELNYKPNQIAKGLRTGKTNTIGLIIADIANPFFGKLGREIEKEAANLGYRVMFCSSDENPENSAKQIEMLQQGQVDGFIIAPPAGSENQILALKRSKTPFVLIDRNFPDIETNYIIVDNVQASYQAVDHLIKKGYKKIACVTLNVHLNNMNQRVLGYKQALIENNIQVNDDLIKMMPFSHEKDDLVNAVKELEPGNKEKVDAVFFATSKLGVMGIETIHSMQLNIPEDIAVVSFDDPDAYKISQPPISAIAQPLKEIGQESIKILFDLMKNRKEKPEVKKIVLQSIFIPRKSSG
ncbi:MAG TPA: substrate-binding domain-containing protein, partial [Draconibacterium sp.]|nr:substrate-binding domain-containing protein [Draconibacterium sp.]